MFLLYYFTRFRGVILSVALLTLLVSGICVSAMAQQQPSLDEKPSTEPTADDKSTPKNGVASVNLSTKPDNKDKDNKDKDNKDKDNKDKDNKDKVSKDVKPDGDDEREVDINSDHQDKEGNVTVFTGNVHVSDGQIQIIADRMAYNNATDDLLAEGNVYLVEEGGEKLTGERLEFNYKTRRGVMNKPTAFTNSTPGGITIVVDALRAEKTNEDTYNMENALVTSCQQKIPKWSFTAKRATIRVDHRAKVYNAFFRIRNIPILWLPYASIPISKKDRSSGLLTPTSGSSTIKGRTLNLAYYQTLGRSADLLVNTDVFSMRGLGLGFQFRAKPDEHSHIDIGSFTVLDRLLGPKLIPGCDPTTDPNKCKEPNQGGTSFYANGVQYFKNGFMAVADVNYTTSFDFRQVFSPNIIDAIDPEERSVFYLNKNWSSYSFNVMVGEQNVFIANSTVKTEQLPSVELSERSAKLNDKLPFYLSFDTSFDTIRRIETTNTVTDFKTPMTERLDLAPRLTFPLKSFAGFTLTPSVTLSSTLYSDSIDPSSPQSQRQVLAKSLLRNYADIDLDLRLPALAKVFYHRDGKPWFKHVIEPYVEYQRILGVNDYNRIPLFDERDLVTNTNQVEYGITNRFFVKRQTGSGSEPQTHELLSLTLAQQYYFDPSFGGALVDGQRNVFSPINTLTGFAFAGLERSMSPLNLKARLYPTNALYTDVQVDYDTHFHTVRDFIVGTGVTRGIFTFGQTWYYTRRIEGLDDSKLLADKLTFDPTTYPGNQFDFSTFVGKRGHGPYGAFTISYDFRDQFFDGSARDPHFLNFSAVSGWAWDCCGFEIQRNTYNFGIRNESRFVFAFTLKGIGTFGNQTVGQLYGQPRK